MSNEKKRQNRVLFDHFCCSLYNIVLAWLIPEVKVIFLEKFHPSGLSSYKVRLSWKVSKDSMVSINNKVDIVQIIVPGFQSMDYSKQFMFMSWIITFSGIYLSGCIGNRI
jgi:hypothetical protein